MRSLQRFLSLVLFAALTAAPVFAAPAWKALGPFGGSVGSLTADPANLLVFYATAGPRDYRGAFKSVNGGASWFPIHTSAAGPMAVSPGTLWLPDGYLLKSTDGGARWTAVAPDTLVSVSRVAVDPTRPSRLYAAAATGAVWRSLDGGVSWELFDNLLPIGFRTVNVLVAAPAGTVFAGTEMGLFRSVDGGHTFRRTGRGLPAGEVLALAIAPSDSSTIYVSLLRAGVFRSGDGGATWQAAARQPVPPTADDVISLAVSPGSSRKVWAGTWTQGLFRSPNGGGRWVSDGLGPGRSVAALAASPSGALYAGVSPSRQDLGGVFVSLDGGASWTRRARGLSAQGVSALAADPAAPGVLWAGLPQGLFRSADGGRRWRLVTWNAPDLYSLGVLSLALDPTAPSTLYVRVLGGLWRTSDAGASWTLRAGPGTLLPNPLWVDPAAPHRLWGIGPFLRSDNGGRTWSPPPSPWLECYTTDFAIAPSDPSTLYVAGTESAASACRFERSVVYRSTDGGATWTRADGGFRGADIYSLAVDPVDPRLVYLAAAGDRIEDGVWKTTDGGVTWSPTGDEIASLRMSLVAASPVAGLVWAASEDGRVFRSRDGGGSWDEVTGGLITGGLYDLVPDPASPRRLFAVTANGVWALEDED